MRQCICIFLAFAGSIIGNEYSLYLLQLDISEKSKSAGLTAGMTDLCLVIGEGNIPKR